MSRRPKVLLAITVYNGWAFVPRALKSAKNLDTTEADIDVLVLDDCSPEPGFSEKLAKLCKELDVKYYGSPRNLGIVRNVNLGLLAATEHGYDYVIISNSDVVYSKGTVNALVHAARSDPRIGSVTAWSNNVSIYSIPNTDPDRFINTQAAVDWIAQTLDADYHGIGIDVPAGISFCVLIPISALRSVGLMDPVYGRGYCEETDWSLRSLSRGFRVVMAPSAFVYHQGRGSTLAAGIVTGGHTTVPENEAIVDYRYPLFRSQVDAFINGGILDRLHDDAVQRLVADAGARFGWEVHVGEIDPARTLERVQVSLTGGQSLPKVRAAYRGFECDVVMYGSSPSAALEAFFHRAPARVDGGPAPSTSAAAALQLNPAYPARV
jgi:GT2 family glycosyltransferase